MYRYRQILHYKQKKGKRTINATWILLEIYNINTLWRILLSSYKAQSVAATLKLLYKNMDVILRISIFYLLALSSWSYLFLSLLYFLFSILFSVNVNYSFASLFRNKVTLGLAISFLRIPLKTSMQSVKCRVEWPSLRVVCGSKVLKTKTILTLQWIEWIR